MGKPDLITLSKTHFLYVAVVLLVVFPVVLGIAAYGNQLLGLWCQKCELPEYEKQFGFRMGDIQVPSGEGGTYTAWAIEWVDPDGVMGRAGVRRGDVPTMHHGVWDFCTSLGWMDEGRPARLEVTNVIEQEPGSMEWRWVDIPATTPSARDP